MELGPRDQLPQAFAHEGGRTDDMIHAVVVNRHGAHVSVSLAPVPSPSGNGQVRDRPSYVGVRDSDAKIRGALTACPPPVVHRVPG
jgi:hypothetical protein